VQMRFKQQSTVPRFPVCRFPAPVVHMPGTVGSNAQSP
jgi:hypothetical protein